MTDIDGTISRIARHPDEATVDPSARRLLDALARNIEVVAAVSGRAAENARDMVGLDSLVYSGNHGMEIWRSGVLEQSDAARTYIPRIDELLGRAERELDLSGVYLENKQLTASIHVRETADPEHAEREVLQVVERLSSELGLRVTRGRMVVEIRPPLDLNKGTSVVNLIERFGLASAIYLGDDTTDVDAFRALSDRRTATGSPFYSVGVVGKETPESVSRYADTVVNGVDGVIEFLEILLGAARPGDG